MAFRPIRQAYRQPLLAWFYKPLFKTLCLIGWRRETPLLPRSSCGPKVSKSFANLLNNIHFPGLHINLQNLEDLQCPPLAQLCPAIQPWSICQKAVRLARWLAITWPPGMFSIQTFVVLYPSFALVTFLFSRSSFFPSTGRSRFQVGGMLGGKLFVLVLDKFSVFYGRAVQIYFTGFDLVSVFCSFFDSTG